MRIEVLRLGHRPQRDKRITTHVCLTARVLGARKVHLAEEDANVRDSVRDLAKRFGGDFQIDHGTGWKGVVRQWQADGGQVVHLTMYGEQLGVAAPRILGDGRDVLVVVGAEKVPGDLYQMADHNVAVGNQPHSEVAALALLMDRLRGGEWEQDDFPGAEVRVLPEAHGKRVETDESSK